MLTEFSETYTSLVGNETRVAVCVTGVLSKALASPVILASPFASASGGCSVSSVHLSDRGGPHELV